MSDLTPEQRKVEPYAMVPKRVLSAPSAVVPLSAKIVYAVLNGQVNARKNKPVHLTQQQIAVLADISPRTVQTAIQKLVAVGLVTVLTNPASNGFKVNSYLVHPVEATALPPVPALPTTYGPYMRSVLEARNAHRREQSLRPRDAESAHDQGVDVASSATQEAARQSAETAHKEEAPPRSPEEEQGQQGEEEAASVLPVFFAEGDQHGFDYPNSWDEVQDAAHVHAQLNEVGGALRNAMERQGWDVEECNDLLRATWDEVLPPGVNLRRALRRARVFA